MLFSLPRKRGINIAKIRGNKVTDYNNWKFVVERWLNAMQYQTKEGDCSVDCASQGSFAEEDSCDCGGMSTPGHWGGH